jgi:hypothetical protein
MGGSACERTRAASFPDSVVGVDRTYREPFNRAFSDDLFTDYRGRLESLVGRTGFRLAETPFFMPADLRDRLEGHARSILGILGAPACVEAMQSAIPEQFRAPGVDRLPTSVQVDFAVVRNERGELDGKVVELQGFPSLYGFTLLQARAWNATLRARAGIRETLFPTFGGLDEGAAVARLRASVCADEDPDAVILLDLQPESQKTYCDFVATEKLLGVEPVCVSELVREGRRLFRKRNGRLLQVKRIYNRVVFDELEKKGVKPPFDYSEDLEVSWCPHPNWYWVWSKYSLPHISHPAVPRARLVSELEALPPDLHRYVLKPLFSFAGSGVVIDVTPEHLEGIGEAQRSEWLLQEKIDYARDLMTPDGASVAVEVRVTCLRAAADTEITPILNLVRLSRGKMHGVDHNKDLKWTGSSVGLTPAP